jgi:enamine deaminase RidA (YjgF/YER057c/UK114 family)
MSVELINPAGVPTVPGVSMAAVRTGSRVIAIAGQVGRNLDDSFEDGLAAQFAKALSNLDVAMAAVGATGADLLKMTVYIKDWHVGMTDELVEGAMTFAASAGRPVNLERAWTLVGVTSLYDPRCLVEVDAMAIIA